MSTASETSDQALLEYLRKSGDATISELCAAADVTPNAVRQRLNRLMAQGMVERSIHRDAGRGNRGRPTHRYSLSEKARRRAGSNFADLATVLWRELRSVPDAEVRRGLLQRLASHMADLYASQVRGKSTSERMASLVEIFAERNVPFRLERLGAVSDQPLLQGDGKSSEPRLGGSELPVLVVEDCPYPQLAEEDRGICSFEKLLFSQLLEENVHLSQCRLDGHSCCQFQTSP